MTIKDRMLRLRRAYSILLSDKVEVSLTTDDGDWFVKLHASDVPMPDIFTEHPHAVNADGWNAVLGWAGTIDRVFCLAEDTTCDAIRAYMRGVFHPSCAHPRAPLLLSGLLHELRTSANGGAA